MTPCLPTRRDCLKALLAAATTSALPAFGKSGESLSLGFGSYGLPDHSVVEAVRLVSEVGFDAIEFACMSGYPGAPDRFTPALRLKVREQAAENGIRIGALMGLPRPDPSRQQANEEEVKRMLELAHDLVPNDPPLIQTVLGGKDWEKEKAVFRDALGSWVELASAAGVRLAIKPHRGQAMNLPEQAIELIDEVQVGDTLGMVYDPSHFVHRGLDIQATVATALPHTDYIVVKDAEMIDGKVRFALPGETGSMPHVEVLSAFLKGGYRGGVCCEVSSMLWRTEGYDAEAATRVSYRNLRRLAEEALAQNPSER